MNYLSDYNMQTPNMQPVMRQSMRPNPVMPPMQQAMTQPRTL